MKLSKEQDFEVNYLNQLVGGKITLVIMSDDLGDPFQDGPFFGFVIRKASMVGKYVVVQEFNVWIMMDPEGNGPGHLQIEKTSERNILSG